MEQHRYHISSHKAYVTATVLTETQEHKAISCQCHKRDVRIIPTNWNALGPPSWAPTLGRTLLPPAVHLKGLEGQLASHRQEDAETQLLTAVTSHCMCHLMTHLHIPPGICYGSCLGPMFANAAGRGGGDRSIYMCGSTPMVTDSRTN